MALPGDHASLIKRALTQLATLFEWRSSHVIGDDHDDRYYTETEVDSLFYTETEVDALLAGIPLTNPGGSNQQVQFNNSGSFGGSSSLTFDSSTGKLTAGGGIDGLTSANGGIAGSNYDITGVNQMTINDEGEGIAWPNVTMYQETGDTDRLTLNGNLLLKATGGPNITIRDTDSSDASGYITFENNAGTRMGYIGYPNNDDIHLKNENSGGHIFFATDNTYRAYVNSSGHFQPYTSNTYDLGTSSVFWRNAYVAGNLYFGANDYIDYDDSTNYFKLISDGTVRHEFYAGRIKVINTGWTTLGADGTWGRLETDRGKFYINKEIWVDEGIIGSYNEDLKLRRAGTDRIICTTSQIQIKDDLKAEHTIIINNSSPTMRFQDTNHKSAFWHCNSNLMYLLRSSGNNGTSWTAHNGIWPVYWNLNNNDMVLGGQIYVQNMVGTWSFNTVRFGTGGILYKYLSLREIKTDITSINPLLDYLGERSLLYDLNPVIFREADDRVNAEGEQFYTTRGEYAPGFIAEEVHEVAPELSVFGDDGELESYSNDALIPHIVAELQRLTPMIESLYSAANPDWDPPVARSVDRGVTEKNIYDVAAARAKANPIVNPNPKNLAEEEEEDE